MLRQPHRLLSSAIAIALGVAFVAATMLLGDSLNVTMREAAAGPIGSASVVVTGASHETVSVDAVAAIRAARGVSGVRTLVTASLQVTRDGQGDFLLAQGMPTLSTRTTLKSGRLPAASGEAAISAAAANGYSMRIGDRLDTSVAAAGPRSVVVVGIIDVGPDASTQPGMPLLFVPDADVLAFSGGGFNEVYVSGPDSAALVATISALPTVTASHLVVRSASDVVSIRVRELSGGAAPLIGVLLGFAAIALFVSALVIANTFAILVAQRIRTLALLRCIGASRRQVFGSVLGEAVVLGIVGSLVGLAVGAGLAWVAVKLSAGTGMALVGFAATPASVIVPLVVGLLVTVLAALSPAWRSTRIAPVAALRVGATTSISRTSIARRVFGGLCLVGGAVALIAGALFGLPVDPPKSDPAMPTHLLVGMIGGAVSFLGIMLLAPAIVPALARPVGRLVSALGGVPGELARDNAVRNPKRAAATASALLVGMTLISMMSVGAATATRSMADRIDARYPVDAHVVAGATALPDSALAAAKAVPGVAKAVWTLNAGPKISVPGHELTSNLSGLDPADADVARGRLTQGLTDDTIIVTPSEKVAAGTPVTVSGPGGSVTLTAVMGPRSDAPMLVTAANLRRVEPKPMASIYVRFADHVDALAVSNALGKSVGSVSPGVRVASAALERQHVNNMVATVLAVVVGLLAIAVVIAVIGIGNTLGLAILERTQETGLLRALGLTRAELRRSIGLEALVLAVTAALFGTGLGVLYGLLGAEAMFAPAIPIVIDVPWGQLALFIGVAVCAGWLAAIVPAWRASRVSPITALATE